MRQRSEIIVLIVAIFCQTECANILGILPMPGLSHFRAGVALFKILAEHGHNVTVVSLFSEKNPPNNYKEIVLEGLFIENEMDDIFKSLANPVSFWEKWTNPFITQEAQLSETENFLKHFKFKNLLSSNETFDVVIMEEFGATALKYAAYYFKAPLIVYSPLDFNEPITTFQGSPENPSYIPIYFADELTSNMDFMERVQSTIFYLIHKVVFKFVMIPSQNEILHKYYPQAPHLNEFIYNVSLALVNADPSVNDPLPRVPSIINIGGFHISKPKALPQDLQELLDGAENGVIFFSLGTNFKSKFIPKEVKELILRVFSRLEEIVLWKFEEDLPGKPDNVHIRKWLPQNDILAHKNVKLFINHGGIFGTMEAIYNGVPMLTFPIFGDQKTNAKQAEAAGYAKWLEFSNLDENEFEVTIKELLTNLKYSEIAKRRSKIFKDKPISPRDSVAFWVDYVIRHKGADHLRVASLNLTWYQNMLLDVICFILGCIALFFVIVRMVIRMTTNFIRKRERKIKTQ